MKQAIWSPYEKRKKERERFSPQINFLHTFSELNFFFLFSLYDFWWMNAQRMTRTHFMLFDKL